MRGVLITPCTAVLFVACSSFGSSDATSPDDAGAGGGDGGAAALDCTYLCDTFEREVLIGSWTEVTTNGAKLELDPTSSASPTRSLRVTVPAGGNLNAALSKQVSTKRRMGASFSLRVDALPSAPIIAVGFYFGNVVDSIQLRLAPSGLVIGELVRPDGGDNYTQLGLGMPPMGKFVRYTLTFDLDAKQIRLKSPSGFDQQKPIAATHGELDTFRVGAMYSDGQSTVATFAIDDVELFDIPAP
jgi:hypothetical protein